LQWYRRACEGYLEQLGPHHALTVDCVHAIGEMLLLGNHPREALEQLQVAFEERSGYYGEAHPQTLATLFCLGKNIYQYCIRMSCCSK
jgi:hypothetical protein